jgi:hypothetical protein
VNPGVAPESWDQWTSRVAAELAGLAEGDWLTLTVAQGGVAGPTGGAGAADDTFPYAAGSAERERRWSMRRRRSSGQAGGDTVPDVFLQARLLEGVLALECISDTEFEGLSDLTPEQEDALVALGWTQDDNAPAFHRTYPDDSWAHPGADSDVDSQASVASVESDATERASTAEATGTDARISTEGPDATGTATRHAQDAARLLRHSLERVLGARSPDDVVLRRSVGDS